MAKKAILVNLRDTHPPLGLAQMASYYKAYSRLKNFEFEIQTNKEWASAKHVAKKTRGADLVGISTFSQEYGKVIEVVNEIRKHSEVPIILGGYHITALPETLPRGADLAVIGEGEQTFLEILDLYDEYGFDKAKLTEIKGMAYHGDSGVMLTEPRPLIDPLDKIPFPDRDLMPQFFLGKRRRFNEVGLGYFIGAHMLTSRGCPYRCVFCASSKLMGRTRFFSAEYVASEMKHLIQKYNIECIDIMDDCAITNQPRLQRLADIMHREGLNKQIKLGLAGRANLMNDKMCELLRTMNVVQIYFGIESGSEKVLCYLKKGSVTIEQNREAIKLCRKYGMNVGATIMIGSPGETAEDIRQTMNFIKEHDLSAWTTTTLTVPLPGSELWEYARSKGMVSDSMDWNKLRLEPLSPNALSFDNKISVSDTLTIQELYTLTKEFLRDNENSMLRQFDIRLAPQYIAAYLADFFRRPGEFSRKARRRVILLLRSWHRSRAKILKRQQEREFGLFLEGNELPYLDYQYHIGRYVFASQFVAGKSVLDVACGTGYGSGYLARRGVRWVVGSDVSPEAISYAVRYYKDEKTEFVPADATRLPFVNNSFDCVVSFETIEHIKEYEKFLSECRRVLKEGGSFICSTPNREATPPILKKPLWQCHVKEFYLAEFHHLLSTYFRQVQVFGQDYLSRPTKIMWQSRGIARSMFNFIPKGRVVADLLSRLIFRRQHHAVRFSMGDMDTMVLREGEVLPLRDNFTPRNIVIVAKDGK